MPEQNADAKRMTPTQRNAELIISRLKEYVSIRFDHAIRINSKLRNIKEDLLFHQMENVRRCLNGEKIYGPIKLYVADVFVGDDDRKRRALMSPTDQTSIQVELVSHCQDERVEATRGQVRIHDLKTFYASIDATIEDFLDLVETWIWWDILDAAEQVRFEQKLSIITMAQQGRLPGELRKRYAALIQRGEDEEPNSTLTDSDVIRYEMEQLKHVYDQWAYRRVSDRGFQFVLKRDERPMKTKGVMIHVLDAKIREYATVEAMDELDDETRAKYAAHLKMDTADVTRATVLEHIEEELIELEREMVQAGDESGGLGPPYRFKARQMEMMGRWLKDLAKKMGQETPQPVEADEQAPTASTGDAPSGG